MTLDTLQALAYPAHVVCTRRMPLVLARGLGLTVLTGAVGLTVALMLAYPPHPYLTRPLDNWGQILFVLIYVGVATFIFFQRTDQPAAAALLISAAAALVTNTAGRIMVLPQGPNDPLVRWLPEAVHAVSAVISYTGLLHFAFVLPEPPRRLRGSALKLTGFIISLYAFEFALMVSAVMFSWWRSNGNVTVWVASWARYWNTGYLLTLVVTGIVASARYRYDFNDDHRRQLRWYIFGGLTIILLNVLLARLPYILDGHDLLDVNGRGLIDTLFPVLVAAVMLRYRVYGIELLIRHSLVYVLLTLSVTVLYTILVVIIGQRFGGESRALQLVTLCITAIALQPLRQRLQMTVNRLMYGERDDPLRVLGRLGRRLESTLLPDQILPAITETLGQAMKLPCVCIALREGSAWQIGAAYPDIDSSGRAQAIAHQLERLLAQLGHTAGASAGTDATVLECSGTGICRWPIVYQGQNIGQLIAFARAPQDNLTSADQQLLAAMARQIGAAAYAVQMTHDLRRSREQILITREEERRRIGRDLHDGLGPTLAGVSLELGALRNLIRVDPARVDTLVADLQTQLTNTINVVRQLVYELRPPVLDQMGLVAAIREQATRMQGASVGCDMPGLQIHLYAPDKLPVISAAVETAAYHIAREALNNVVKHSRAHICQVSVYVRDQNALPPPFVVTPQSQPMGRQPINAKHDNRLIIEVCDDGVGVTTRARQSQPGIGLTSMRERAEELGGQCEIETQAIGGTRVHATLPLD